MKPLSEQAAEYLQEQYRHTLHYAGKNFVVNLANLFAKQPLPEPQYKDRYTESVYYVELIATMDYLYEQRNRPKTVRLSDCLNDKNIKLTRDQVRAALDDIFGEDRSKWQ
ncbi:hypothetical protein ACSFB8_04410 [Enterococcus faecalis]